MQVRKGHLTAGNKKAIKEILRLNLKAGRVGRTTYHVEAEHNGWYKVYIFKMDRGLFDCAGSPLRESTSTAIFKP